MNTHTFYTDENVTLLTGDAATVLRTLPSGHADMILAAPPLPFSPDLGLHGQIGIEETLTEYLARLSEVFTEAHRVLGDRGTLWITVGDCYASRPDGARTPSWLTDRMPAVTTPAEPGQPQRPELTDRALLGLPWRVAFALQNTGLWALRSEIIWHRPDALPNQLHDRPARKHSTVLLFSKTRSGGSYRFDAAALRPAKGDVGRHRRNSGRRDLGRQDGLFPHPHPTVVGSGNGSRRSHPPDNHSAASTTSQEQDSVWTTAADPRHGVRGSGFPVELARRAMAAGCPPGGRVLDPFSGYAAAGVAARASGFAFSGIDLHPGAHYVATERLGLNPQGDTA